MRALALSMMTFLTACAATEARRVEAAGQTIGAVRASTQLPPWPDRCRKVVRSGVTVGDDARRALEKTDWALAQQQDIGRVCAAWYDTLRAKFADLSAE